MMLMKELIGRTEQIFVDEVWVNVHPGRANDVVAEALAAGAVSELCDLPTVAREQRLGESRVDFHLTGARGAAWVEVKSVSLREHGEARFPDSVTTRGARHLRELVEALGPDTRGVLLFLVARGDAEVVAPADDIDPGYGSALRPAVAAGVEVLPYRCAVDAAGLRLTDRLRLRLD